MFKFVKTGLTLGGKVWEEGEIVKPSQDVYTQIKKWYEIDGGKKTLNGEKIQYIVKLSTEKKIEVKESSEEDEELAAMEVTLEEKGLTFEEAAKMSWKKLTKAVGPKLGKQIRDYDKSNNKK